MGKKRIHDSTQKSITNIRIKGEARDLFLLDDALSLPYTAANPQSDDKGPEKPQNIRTARISDELQQEQRVVS